ncbi:BspA family leucine-rich repeat surface protein [Campylobacter lari]|nr:BspA family leucine-rich repeat surface protein [Campylobacter lari]EAK0953644.1 BspA family leucine-rich repeat surface protein [Campylobacter lari]
MIWTIIKIIFAIFLFSIFWKPILIILVIVGILFLIYYCFWYILLIVIILAFAIFGEHLIIPIMFTLCTIIIIGILYYIYTKILSLKNYHPKTKDELKELIKDKINLKDIDTRFITDMSELFKNSTRSDFKGLKYWDVSNVKSMASMFEGCENFNQDLSSWDISKVKNMDFMFENCVNFNQDLSNWDTSKVDYMHKMFRNCHKLDKSIAQKWKLDQDYLF